MKTLLYQDMMKISVILSSHPSLILFTSYIVCKRKRIFSMVGVGLTIAAPKRRIGTQYRNKRCASDRATHHEPLMVPQLTLSLGIVCSTFHMSAPPVRLSA